MHKSWNVYPRPQLVRDDWLSLDGEWDFRIHSGSDGVASLKAERITVPYCPESRLSGIERRIGADEFMIYERSFVLPDEWLSGHIVLHFGAVDQTASVMVNNEPACEHEGGYLPFEMDITGLVHKGINKLSVEVRDSLDHKYPWGKQKRDNGGMWYTPVSGIWQSVWLEPVPEEHITSLKIDTGYDWAEIRAYGIESGTIDILGESYELLKETATDEPCASIRIDIHHPHLWSPEDPYLYDFEIRSRGGDVVKSYFALRVLSIEEHDGVQRLCLNGEPYFFNGLLDQGYWQDGIYTPPAPEAFAEDILAMKSLGFNTLRKHIKIEPELFYYECDRLGMVVFQDMVNNSDYSFIRDTGLPTIGIRGLSDKNRHADPETRRIFTENMEGTVKHLYNHPSVCYWTIFNEGWGQFDADAMYDRLAALDSTRFIDSTSGWFQQTKSDVDSYHVYFKKIDLHPGSRPLVLSEFGGYSCRIPGHLYNDNNYGYRKCSDEAALLSDLADLYDREVKPLMDKGLSAAIFTQLSDVEEETNGIFTYDRQKLKFRSYVGTGRIEIIGNHTDHQGGRVMVAPTKQKIRAYVADNHLDVIRVNSEGHQPFEVSLTDRSRYEKGTSTALLTGMLDGFADLFGTFDASGRGCDIYVKSEVAVGSGLSSSAAFEILLARIINDRYFDSKADAVDLARIGQFAEREYYGKPCGLMDQLAISLARPAMIDFQSADPEIEYVDMDLESHGYTIDIVPTESSHDDLDDEYASVPDDMFAVAKALGVERLGDLNEEQFRRKLSELREMVEKGELTELQLNRAQHFYDENERVLAAAMALETGNINKFLQCINASGLSSENLLQNVLPPGMEENGLSRALDEYKKKPDTAAVRLLGGGFGGSIMVIRRI
jgi:galactokinase